MIFSSLRLSKKLAKQKVELKRKNTKITAMLHIDMRSMLIDKFGINQLLLTLKLLK